MTNLSGLKWSPFS